MLQVVLKLNGAAMRKFEFAQDRVTVGRKAGNDIRIDNLAVSGSHAVIEKECGSYYLVDEGSTNGTFFGGERVTRKALNDGDEVAVGKHTLLFRLPRPGDPPPEAEAAESAPSPTDLDDTVMIDARQRAAQPPPEPPAAVRNPAGWTVGNLTVLKGDTGQRSYVLTSEYVLIGKDPSALVRLSGWRAPQVGGFISRVKDGYRLVPPETRSRISLNGKPVRESTLLCNGDTIEVHGVALRFSLRAA